MLDGNAADRCPLMRGSGWNRPGGLPGNAAVQKSSSRLSRSVDDMQPCGGARPSCLLRLPSQCCEKSIKRDQHVGDYKRNKDQAHEVCSQMPRV